MKIYIKSIQLILTTSFLLLFASTLFGQDVITVELSPVIDELDVPMGGSLYVNNIVILAKNVTGGSYNVRIIMKRDVNTLFTLYDQQKPLVQGDNYIIDVAFTIDASLFVLGEEEGEIYAEVQRAASGSAAYQSATIKVVRTTTTAGTGGSGPNPSGVGTGGTGSGTSGTGVIVNNVICCNQCILAGETPDLIGQAPGRILSGYVVSSSTAWELLPDGYKYSGYIWNKNSLRCSPTPTTRTVKYKRLLNAHNPPPDVELTDEEIIFPFAEILNPTPKSYDGEGSNWITITVSSLTPSRTFTTTNYQVGGLSKTAGYITIQGNQSVTNLSSGTVEYVAARQVRILPDSKISSNITLRVDLSLMNCGSSGRTASDDEIVTQSDLNEPVTVIAETKNYETLVAYPNPTSGETIVSYKVAKGGYVKVYITDSMGIPTLTLVDKENVEAGEYQAVFNSKGLSSGIYLYTLMINGYREVKRLTVINQ